MSFELGLALQGELGEFIEGELETVARGAMDAAYRMEARGKSELRADVTRAGLGKRLANTWRARTYPTRSVSMEPKVRFENKASTIINAFETGATIRSGKGFYLPIPTDDFLSSVSLRDRSRNRKNLIALAERKFGKLQFIAVRGKRIGLLVAKGLQKSRSQRGGFRAASATAQRLGKVADVVLFVLVPQARLKKRLNYESIANDLLDEWGRELADGVRTSLASGRPATALS